MSLKAGTHNKPKAAMTIMEKRLPQNPKYKDTQSRLDTGSTVNKVRLISSKEFLKRRDETFRRVTPRCLAELFSEYEDTGKGDAAAPELVARMVKNADGEYVMERQVSDDNQEHAGPRIVSYDAEEGENYDVPYLILDTRPREDFAQNRIHRSKSFPTAFLCRDQFLPEMHQFKNQESKLIVLYCMDEKLSIQSANLLGQKGFDNIYVLTGGLCEYAALFPEHVEGTLPPRPKSTGRDTAKKPSRDLYKSGTALTSSSVKSVAGSMRKKPDGDSDVSSIASHQSVAESIISKATMRKASIKHGGSGSRGSAAGGNSNFR
ncbi:hypothetical protein H310_00454 [Aphanomyces invadans]|uniref:Rhodanese domain-containing protein n=1 Tax=Aphanomyces invadans TaxID=157072 RepID=A0A024UWM4_9STRA|nr:hypothetical protein H310_00454 [Aphanomyces invadans]ETW10068.1 hypothetical protein H310_00454 [Aphanomyces invadans]|eukprot:XP_008861479.1 hypothetical protein H310_00454 [Aphanomyces invadans]